MPLCLEARGIQPQCFRQPLQMFVRLRVATATTITTARAQVEDRKGLKEEYSVTAAVIILNGDFRRIMFINAGALNLIIGWVQLRLWFLSTRPGLPRNNKMPCQLWLDIVSPTGFTKRFLI